ncbi:hypothetical protein MCBMB27_05741 (plasmid) [Methylobacterium phyllosphaerae]|uniref:Uncharacterized protein n=1 Tax=Methylobacterium phyllosphaerae TaxID=418223 RepID=A0AAE8L9K5_9HYPH|nr:hypothetical protein [Methylobacterium phyllosphaerae]APT35032.1 hypothetical protein MCBMB27_05741 [Methylobacterium phyllosphaerae]SFH67087.1 hypothetical protein SAMN05192567_1425 [Methylobacterium phyllosphaerae]
MISFYQFFYDFFLDVPSFGIAIFRGVKIYLIAIFLLAICMLMDISAKKSAVVISILMFLPPHLVYQYFLAAFQAELKLGDATALPIALGWERS